MVESPHCKLVRKISISVYSVQKTHGSKVQWESEFRNILPEVEGWNVSGMCNRGHRFTDYLASGFIDPNVEV